MGKGSRTKNSRAQSVLSTQRKSAPLAARRKKEMPTWVGTLIVVVVLAALLLLTAAAVLNSRGVFLAGRTIAKSDNYEVSVPMMSYMVYTTYRNFVNSNSQYLSYIKGTDGDALNTSASLRSQVYSRTTDQATGEVTVVTWFDFFASQASEDVKQILLSCEAANRYGIELTSADYESMDDAETALRNYAKASGYSLSSYLSNMFGKGVNMRAVRKMMSLSLLATRYTAVVNDEVAAGVTDAAIQAAYEAGTYSVELGNISAYQKGIDYTGKTFTATFVPVEDTDPDAAAKNAEAKAAYEALCDKYAAWVNSLSQSSSKETFIENLTEYVNQYSYEGEDSEKAAQDVEKLLATDDEDPEPTDGSEAVHSWLANENRVTGEVEKFVERKAAYEEGVYSKATSTFGAYYVVSGWHLLKQQEVRDVGHILFKTDTFKDLDSAEKLTGATKELAERVLASGKKISAETMAAQLIAEMKADGILTEVSGASGKTYLITNRAAFRSVAERYTEDSNVFYSGVKTGEMVAEFEDWLFDSERVDNEVTAEAVKTTYGYHIMYYGGAEKEWQSVVRQQLQSDAVTVRQKELSTLYNVEFTNNWSLIG